MAWLPSHQGLKDHPKLRRAAASLNVPRVEMIGHLHCLWWWALDYAPDGDLSRFDDVDIALAAEWADDSRLFIEALKNCGPGERAGFIDEDMVLHNWDLYAGRWDKQKSSKAGTEGNHIRWHVKRGVTDETCRFCRPESGGDRGRIGAMQPDHIDRCDDDNAVNTAVTLPAEPSTKPQVNRVASGGDRGANPPESQSREEESREDWASDKPKPRRASSLPSGWKPNETHRAIASELNVDVDAEATQFSDFHQAKGSTFKDWDAAFRTWLRNASKFASRHLRAVGESQFDTPKERYT